MASASTYATLPRSAAGRHSPWLIAIVVSLATFMEVLDTTIANVSLVHIAGSLSASQDESTYIVTSYLVSNAIVLPISGWLSDVIGRKRFYMICVAIFTASSVACGFATSLESMILFRVLQGIGGGGLAPVEQSIFADSFPEKTRPIAFSLYGLTVVSAPAIGPVLGGWMTDNYSWHWVFFINLPIGLISLGLTWWFVSDSPTLVKERRQRLSRGLHVDYPGFLFVALGFGGLQIVLDKWDRADGFASSFITWASIVAGVSIVLLVIRELTTRDPVVNLRLFRSRAFAISNIMLFIVGFLISATTQLLPQMTQSLMGYDATTAGMTLALGGILTVLVMPFSGILSKVVQPKWLLAMAFAGSAWGLWKASGLDLQAGFGDIAWARTAQIAWMPFLMVPLTSLQYVGIPPNRTGDASAITNMMRNFGGSFGVAIVTTMLARQTQRHHAALGAHVTAYSGYPPGGSLTGIADAVQRQAAILSYLDIFVVLGWLALAVVPLCLFLPKLPKGTGNAGH